MTQPFTKIGLLLLLGFSTLGLAQGTKVGIVDAELVIQNSIKGKRFFKEMDEFGKTRSQQIEAKVAEFRDLEKEYKAKFNSLSEDKRDAMALDLQNLELEVKRLREDAKREQDRKVNTALDKFRKELAPLIRQVAEEQGYDIIINHGPQSNLVFFSKAVDITEAVVGKYDATVED